MCAQSLKTKLELFFLLIQYFDYDHLSTNYVIRTRITNSIKLKIISIVKIQEILTECALGNPSFLVSVINYQNSNPHLDPNTVLQSSYEVWRFLDH